MDSQAPERTSAKDNARRHQTSDRSTDGGGDWLDASAHTLELSDENADTDEERRQSGKRAALVTQERREERLRSSGVQQTPNPVDSADSVSETPFEAQLVNQQLLTNPLRRPEREPATTQTDTAVQTDPIPEQLNVKVVADSNVIAAPSPSDSVTSSASHFQTVDLTHSGLGTALNETEFEVLISYVIRSFTYE